MRVKINAGDRYGRLIVTEEIDRPPPRQFICRCDCGDITAVWLRHLRNGHTTSCGCAIRKAATSHGMSYSATYRSWRAMVNRCNNHACNGYHNYGGRGIEVCDRWRAFANFLEDVGARPSAEHTLDRIDNDGNYEQGNVRWSTAVEQHRNTRRNHFVTCNGKTLCVAEWAERTGLLASAIHSRLRAGWSEHDAVTVPLGTRGRWT